MERFAAASSEQRGFNEIEDRSIERSLTVASSPQQTWQLGEGVEHPCWWALASEHRQDTFVGISVAEAS